MRFWTPPTSRHASHLAANGAQSRIEPCVCVYIYIYNVYIYIYENIYIIYKFREDRFRLKVKAYDAVRLAGVGGVVFVLATVLDVVSVQALAVYRSFCTKFNLEGWPFKEASLS